MNVFICPDCGALCVNKKKHALSHAHPPSGEWETADLTAQPEHALTYETLDKERNA